MSGSALPRRTSHPPGQNSGQTRTGPSDKTLGHDHAPSIFNTARLPGLMPRHNTTQRGKNKHSSALLAELQPRNLLAIRPTDGARRLIPPRIDRIVAVCREVTETGRRRCATSRPIHRSRQFQKQFQTPVNRLQITAKATPASKANANGNIDPSEPRTTANSQLIKKNFPSLFSQYDPPFSAKSHHVELRIYQ
jgi:hypothetical protein